MATDSLLHEFPPVATEAWEEAIVRDLKGADYDKKLLWKTDEGLAVKPYYRAEDLQGLEYLDPPPGHFPYARGAQPSAAWRIREEIDEVNPELANQAAQSALAVGAEEIAFRNVSIHSASDLGMLLVNLHEIPVHFCDAGEPLIRLLIARQRLSPASTGFDPLANLDFAAEILAAAPPALTPFTIHGEEFEESGATAVEEVGFTLAAGIEFLAEMQARNVNIDRAAASLEISFAIGANFFFQIAKFRAFRLLWARAVESFGGAKPVAAARIHARTSRWNKTVYDPHVNILRGTTETLSAALGGANSISVAPFDACYKAPDEASRRLARNTQILLKHEAFLSRVADPAAGSYAIEVITDFIAREGWRSMQAIEAAGGFRKANADGQIARALEQSMAAREKAVASRRRVFTGTNQYPNPSETALDRIDVERVFAGRRATQGFERLRLRTERNAVKTGQSPLILLAEIGDVKMRAARSNFAANLFGCAGLPCVTRQFSTTDAIATADAGLIVLCSSDAEYLELGWELMSKLTELRRNTPVLIAGNPDSADQLRTAGVTDFVHIRTNPIEFLAAWQLRLGIEE